MCEQNDTKFLLQELKMTVNKYVRDEQTKGEPHNITQVNSILRLSPEAPISVSITDVMHDNRRVSFR